MDQIAAFAESPSGRLYGFTCERYGVDPARHFDDDVLAANLRASLALTTLPETGDETDSGSLFDADRKATKEAFG